MLGTKFNIEAYPDSETITTTLLEGSVEVESRLSRECIRMVPSQQLSYDIQSGEMKLSTISDSKEPVRWKDNVWVLHQTPFTQVCHRLEQMFNVKIVIMNDQVHREEIYRRVPFRGFAGIDPRSHPNNHTVHLRTRGGYDHPQIKTEPTANNLKPEPAYEISLS